jgi:predicted nucleic acid-binding protein
MDAVTSAVSLTEVLRAIRRYGASKADDPEGLLEAFAILELTPAICRTAGALDPIVLRSLDAIHLASVLSIGEPRLELVTYDDRLARAAAQLNLKVAQPGRT